MRVLHIDGGRRWGGGQNQVRLLMRELARLDVAQSCICPAGSPLAERLAHEALPVEPATWRRGSDPRALATISRAVAHADVVHCHDAHAFQLALVPARLTGTPIIAARRVCFTTRPLKWNRASRVIAISAAVRATLEGSGVRPDHIRIVHSGVDIEELAALPAPERPLRQHLRIPPDRFLAGNIGTLLEFKQQTLIVEAAARARDVDWVIIGEGPRRAAIEAAIARHDAAANTHLTGQLPDARRFLREMDVFVFASRGEALGTSVLDAMALGVPVVAANDAGPAEVLAPVHAVTGASLFPPADAAALAAAVHRVRDDPSLRARMAEAQRSRVEDFRIEHTAAATLDVYHELVRTR